MRTNDYASVADALRRIADSFDTVAGLDMPDVWVSMSIQPGGNLSDDVKIEAIDTVARELFGTPATTRELSGGAWHHTVSGQCGPVHVGVFNSVASPVERQMRAELAALRAVVADHGRQEVPA